MKKYFTTPEYKRFNTARSNKVIRMRYRRRKRVGREGATDTNSPVNRLPVVNILAPENYSLVYNTEDTIKYYNKIRDRLSSGQRVRFDLSNVKRMTTDAIAVQIAKIKDERFNRRIPIYGNAPKDVGLSNLFLHSGFYDHVKVSGAKPSSENKLIHEITANKVEPDIAKEACLLGLNHTFQYFVKNLTII